MERTSTEVIADLSTSELERQERRKAVIQGRIDGKTFRAIAEDLGISVGLAHADYKQAIHDIPAHNVDEYRLIELERLEWALDEAKSCYREWSEPADKMRALSQFLTAERGIRVLVGADAPLRQEVLVLTDEILERKKAELLEERQRRLQLMTG